MFGYGTPVDFDMTAHIDPGDPICSCTDLEHDNTCPANPDPARCFVCGDALDPGDDDYRDPSCQGDHCHDCSADCPPCSRPGRLA